MEEIGEGDQEYTYDDEHCVIYRIIESYCMPPTDITLYVIYTVRKEVRKLRS